MGDALSDVEQTPDALTLTESPNWAEISSWWAGEAQEVNSA